MTNQVDQQKEKSTVYISLRNMLSRFSAFSPYCANFLLFSTTARFKRMHVAQKRACILCVVVSVTVVAATEVYHLIRISCYK